MVFRLKSHGTPHSRIRQRRYPTRSTETRDRPQNCLIVIDNPLTPFDLSPPLRVCERFFLVLERYGCGAGVLSPWANGSTFFIFESLMKASIFISKRLISVKAIPAMTNPRKRIPSPLLFASNPEQIMPTKENAVPIHSFMPLGR